MIRFNSSSGGKHEPSDIVRAGAYLAWITKTRLGQHKKSGNTQLMVELVVKEGGERRKVTLWIAFHRPNGTDIAVGRDQIRAMAQAAGVDPEGEWDERALEKKVVGVYLDYEPPRGQYGPRNVLPVENSFFPAVQEQDGIWRLPNPLPVSPLDDGAAGPDGPPADYDDDRDIPF